jgi:hypothetical protein
MSFCPELSDDTRMVELITHNVTNAYGGLLWQNMCLLRVTYSHVSTAEPDILLAWRVKVNPLVFFFSKEMFLLR